MARAAAIASATTVTHRSTNGGASWQAVGAHAAYHLMIDPTSPFTFNVRQQPEGISRSTGIAPWESIPLPSGSVTTISGATLDGRSGDLYVALRQQIGGSFELWRSSNPAAANPADVGWSRLHSFPAGVSIESTGSGHDARGLVLFAAYRTDAQRPISADLYRSTDGGAPWATRVDHRAVGYVERLEREAYGSSLGHRTARW